jgi:serine/threonine protein kinase
LVDFGLAKRIEKSSNIQSQLYGMVTYIDPQIFSRKGDDNNQIQIYSLNKKSDVYSIGVLLWEISSGQPPFKEIPSYYLVVQAPQGRRETPVPGTPAAYVNLYTGKY